MSNQLEIINWDEIKDLGGGGGREGELIFNESTTVSGSECSNPVTRPPFEKGTLLTS